MNSVKVGLSVLFLMEKTYCYFQVQQAWVFVFCALYVANNVKFIMFKLWFSSSSVIIPQGYCKDVVTLFMLNRLIAILIYSTVLPKDNCSQKSKCQKYFLYLLPWLYLISVNTTHDFIQQSPELRFCAGSNLARGVSMHCNGENLWRQSRLETRFNVFCPSTCRKQN